MVESLVGPSCVFASVDLNLDHVHDCMSRKHIVTWYHSVHVQRVMMTTILLFALTLYTLPWPES